MKILINKKVHESLSHAIKTSPRMKFYDWQNGFNNDSIEYAEYMGMTHSYLGIIDPPYSKKELIVAYIRGYLNKEREQL